MIEPFEVKLEDLPSYKAGVKEGLKEGVLKTILRVMKKKYQLSKSQEQDLKPLLTLHSLKRLTSRAALLTPISLEDLLVKRTTKKDQE